jgi:hypothetical protein
MHTILFFGIDTDLRDGEEGGKEGMVCEEDIIEIDFSGLGVIDKVAIGVVDTVEQEASEVHGYEIKVHALNAK